MNPPTDLALIRPDGKRMEQFLDFCRETWGHVHDSYILRDPGDFKHWRHTLLEDYRKAEQGIDQPPGFTRSVTFWVLKNGRIIGIVNFRPELTPELEKYGGHVGLAIRPSERGKGCGKRLIPLILETARGLGIGELLLTGEADNLPSVRLGKSFPHSGCEYAETMVGGRRCKIYRIRIRLSGV